MLWDNPTSELGACSCGADLKSCCGEAWCAVPLVSDVTILGTPLWAASCAALLRYRDFSSIVHREFIGDSLCPSTVCLQVIEGDTEVSEPRGGEERRRFVENLERRTKHVTSS